MRQITGRFSTTVCTSWLVTIFMTTMLFVGMFCVFNEAVSAHDSQRIGNIEGNLRAELGQAQTGPDLVVSVGGPSTITVGGSGSFTLVVKNDSTFTTTEKIEFEATVDLGGETTAKVAGIKAPKDVVTCTQDGNVVKCHIYGLVAGASTTVEVQVQGLKEADLVHFHGRIVPLREPSDISGNNEKRHFFNIIAPTKPTISFIPMNYGDEYQVVVIGEVTLDTGDTYQISLDESVDGTGSASFEWAPDTNTSFTTTTAFKSVDLEIELTSTASFTATEIATDTAPMAYLGFNAVPASGIASIGSPSLTSCGMSAYVTPPPVSSANVDAERAQPSNAQGGADLELTCSNDDEVEWHDQPNVGFANIHANFEPIQVQAACASDNCTATRTVQLNVTIEALPEVAAFLPLVY